MDSRYDPRYVEPRPWVLGGSNGRGLTTESGYVGDGLIADFDTKAHAEHALKCINGYDDIEQVLQRVRKALVDTSPVLWKSLKADIDRVLAQTKVKHGE